MTYQRTPGVATPQLIDFMSTAGPNPLPAMLTASSLAHTANNQAILVKFTPAKTVTVSGLRWLTGTAQSGNYDIGIYTEAGTLLWAKGSTAWPAATTAIVETVSPTVRLEVGVGYHLALAADNTTGTWRGSAEAASGHTVLLDGTTQYAKAVGTSFPLPASITPGNSRSGRAPLIIIHGT